MANKEMKTIQFPNSETVYEIVDNAAREALAGKQPTGDYATKTELTEGLAGKQPTGDYATTASLNTHTGNTNNPHGVTKTQVGLENVANERQYSSQNPPPYPVTSVSGKTGAITLSKADVGLSNVDNTSDTNKPVSTPQATAIAEAKQAGTNAQNAIDTHAAKVNNPHNVTAAQVGAYVKPSEGIPETDLSAEVQEKLNATVAAENLLQSSVTANRQAGVTQGDMVNLGYSLGLEEGKMYTVKYKFNESDIIATAKYEAPTGLPMEGGELCLCQSMSADGQVMTFPMLLGISQYSAAVEDYMNAAQNYGLLFIVDKHQVTGDMTYSDDENNSSVYLRALQPENAQNAVSIELSAIEPFAEVVADKVKNPLTIGDVVFDGSSAKSVDLSEYAKINVKTATEWETDNTILGVGVFGYDTTGKIIKIGDGATPWKALPFFITSDLSFSKASWGQIAALSEGGSASKYFSVGDEKTIELTTGEQVTFVILGFNHDDLTSGGKAGITIGMKNLLADTYEMNETATNAGGWNDSAMRTSTMETLLSQLPSDLQNVIKQVNKKATAGGESTTITTSSDKLWLFSEVEIDGTTSAGYADEGEQYEYWKTVKDGKTSADRIKYLSNGGGEAYIWWLRSPALDFNNKFMCFLMSDGSRGSIDALMPLGVCFGFCI